MGLVIPLKVSQAQKLLHPGDQWSSYWYLGKEEEILQLIPKGHPRQITFPCSLYSRGALVEVTQEQAGWVGFLLSLDSGVLTSVVTQENTLFTSTGTSTDLGESPIIWSRFVISAGIGTAEPGHWTSTKAEQESKGWMFRDNPSSLYPSFLLVIPRWCISRLPLKFLVQDVNQVMPPFPPHIWCFSIGKIGRGVKTCSSGGDFLLSQAIVYLRWPFPSLPCRIPVLRVPGMVHEEPVTLWSSGLSSVQI